MNLQAEWLETDGHGGFASGTVGGARTRRYHALLLPATQPPVGRMVLVNGVEVWLQTAAGRYPLSTQCYQGGVGAGDVPFPRGYDYLEKFEAEPWPRWTYLLPDGSHLTQEIFIHQGTGLTVLAWERLPSNAGVPPADGTLELRPLLSGRDYHSLEHENPVFNPTPVAQGAGTVLWQPYPGVPGTRAWSNGAYRHDPEWYHNFLYTAERARGLDFLEDLMSPGVISCELRGGRTTAVLLLGAVRAAADSPAIPLDADLSKMLARFRTDEQGRRAAFPDRLRRSGDAYIVRGGRGTTIIAGYPWFTDWGRDTFISLRGLCLATGRLDEAREILVQWSAAVSAGMLPNRFPDGGEAPEYNTVDAALWFVVVADAYLERVPGSPDSAALLATCEEILSGYAEGTRFGIRLDPADGLLAAGEPGLALTWMDARVDGRAITPRIGKPVEVQALWLNALSLMAPRSPRWQAVFALGRAQFGRKFWNAARGCLYDVIDCNGQSGQSDGSLRPNQIFAVGGLPLVLLDAEPARAVVETVQRTLLTPLGLRTLAASEPGYAARYEGNSAQRDSVYHQGTVWPWLLGPFVEAWVRVRGDTPEIRAEARAKYVDPLVVRLPDFGGVNHLPEIADADPPHTPRGCPYQAWSVGELTRLALEVLR